MHPLFHGKMQLLEQLAPPLIQYFAQSLLPEKFFRDTSIVPLAKTRHAAAIHSDLQTIMSEPVHLYAFLAAYSKQMVIKEERLLLPDLSEEAAARLPTFFRLKAIDALRQRLPTTAVTPALVVTVFRIANFHYYSDEYEAARPHIQAMYAMIQELGGIHTIDDYFTEQIILLDWMKALKTLSKPQLFATWDPGRNDPEIGPILDDLRSSPDELGSRLHEVIGANYWPESLANAVTDLVEVTRFNGWVKHEQSYRPEFCKWAINRHLAIGNRLLHLGAFESPKVEILRTALILWTALTRSPRTGIQCGSRSTPLLRAKIEASGAVSGWQFDLDVLLWVASTGYLTSRYPYQRNWFTGLVQLICHRIGVQSFVDLEAVIGKFLYERELQQRRLRALAVEIDLT